MASQRTFPKFSSLSRKDQLDLRNFLTQFYTLNDQVQVMAKASAPAGATAAAVASASSVSASAIPGGGSSIPSSPDVTPQVIPQYALIPSFSALPSLTSPYAQAGELIQVNGVLYVFNTSPAPGGWQAVTASSSIIDTHAHRTNYAPSAYAGVFYFETDRTLLYLSNGANWVYVAGMFACVFAAIPAGLGLSDAGLQIWVTIQNHKFRWSGSSWTFIDDEGGYTVDRVAAPTSTGWQLCDGTATDFLQLSAGSIVATPYTTVDEHGNPGTYHASIAAYTGTINPAVAPSISGATDVDGGAGQVVQSGTGVTVAAHTHTHAKGSLVTSLAGGDPVGNVGMLRYFRR